MESDDIPDVRDAPQYDSPRWWAESASDSTLFNDWVASSLSVAALVAQLVSDKRGARALVVGNGMSGLAHALRNTGFGSVIAVDSCATIQYMQMKHEGTLHTSAALHSTGEADADSAGDQNGTAESAATVQYLVADVHDLSVFPPASFDVIVDKALCDILMCYDDDQALPKADIEYARVLRPGGLYVLVSALKLDSAEGAFTRHLHPLHFTTECVSMKLCAPNDAADMVDCSVIVCRLSDDHDVLVGRGCQSVEDPCVEARLAALKMEMQDTALFEQQSGSKVTNSKIDRPLSGQALEDRIESVKIVLRKLYNGERELCQRFLVPEYWRQLVAGTGLTMSVGDPLQSASTHSHATVTPASATAAAHRLDEQGHCVLEDVDWKPRVAFQAFAEGVKRIKAAGWPATFLLLYDQPWQIVDALFALIGPLLADSADDLELETDIFVWALEKRMSDGQYVNGNFAQPHRDSSYDDSVDEHGRPIKLSVWVPLVDATLDNGCMYVLPSNCDPLFDKPEHPEHMCAATSRKGELTCGFPLHHVRPLPARAGSVLCWMGNLIHWGSSCSPHASVEQPRISMALTLRRRAFHSDEKVATLTGRAPMARPLLRDMGLSNRLSVVGKSLIMYYHWMNGYAGLDLEHLTRGVPQQ